VLFRNVRSVQEGFLLSRINIWKSDKRLLLKYIDFSFLQHLITPSKTHVFMIILNCFDACVLEVLCQELLLLALILLVNKPSVERHKR